MSVSTRLILVQPPSAGQIKESGRSNTKKNKKVCVHTYFWALLCYSAASLCVSRMCKACGQSASMAIKIEDTPTAPVPLWISQLLFRHSDSLPFQRIRLPLRKNWRKKQTARNSFTDGQTGFGVKSCITTMNQEKVNRGLIFHFPPT